MTVAGVTTTGGGTGVTPSGLAGVVPAGQGSGRRSQRGARLRGRWRGGVPAAAGVALAAGLGAWPVAQGSRLVGVLVALGVAGTVAAAGTWWWQPAACLGLAALVAQYAILVSQGGGALHQTAALEAAGLVLMVELASWGGQARATVPVASDPRSVALRAGTVLLTGLAALAAAAVTLAVAGVGQAGSAVWEVIGGVAVLAAAAVVAAAVRRLY